jgi:hypothetical protein
MTDNRPLRWLLYGYLALVLSFIFAPILFSVIFSFNSDRFPTIPLGSFTLKWYRTVWNDPDVWEAGAHQPDGLSVDGDDRHRARAFATAYTDYRYSFRLKPVYLGLVLLPPTIPLIIMALAMLAWFAKLGISGTGDVDHHRAQRPDGALRDGDHPPATEPDGSEPGIRRMESWCQPVERAAPGHRAVLPAGHHLVLLPDGGGVV